MHKLGLALIGLIIGFCVQTASAADLYLLCNVTVSKGDGSQVSYKLRYELTWDTRTVRIHENDGSGWYFVGTRTRVVANDDEIILQDSVTARYAINRGSGQITGRRKSDGTTMLRGSCERSSIEQNKF
ncbi:hypothetical protein PMI03_03204 [Rhizobium sp. AP16]|nr:hypothetical protein PMI03_03204 [Rhizobium sp. AP16]